MHLPILLLLLVFCVLLATISEEDLTPIPDLVVPRPSYAATFGEAFTLQSTTSILTDADPDVAAVGKLLAERLRDATGYSIPVETGGPKSGKDVIVLTTADADATLCPEGYSLTVSPDAIVIRAPRPAGLFYGTQSLRQLLPPDIERSGPSGRKAWTVPGVELRDRPGFSVRGFMLDSCRHFQSVEFIKRTIDLLAYHKINVFHWHLTEDQGWRIEIRKHPKLTQAGAWGGPEGDSYGGFYTQGQIRDVVDYAAARFVTVVPEVDMPGHMVAALACYPELGCTGGPYEVRREWGIAEDVLCPGKDATFQFVEDVLTEVLDLFPSKVIHIGGDECPRVRWTACPHCQELIRREGLPDAEALQNYFTRRVIRFLESRGRRLQGWNEILAGGELPKDVIVHQWNWESAGADAARAGNEVVYSMHPSLYFDRQLDDLTLEKVYACEPVPQGLSEEEQGRILGPEACLWTEYRPTEESDDEFTWPRAIALAEAGWTAKERRDWDSFKRRLTSGHYQRVANIGLGVPAPPAATLKGLIERGDS